PTNFWRKPPRSSSGRRWAESVSSGGSETFLPARCVREAPDGMNGERFAMLARIAGHNARFAAASIEIAGVPFTADASGVLFWEEERLLIVSDLHLEKGSSFATRGILLPPWDTAATLAQLAVVISRYDPRTVIALGDSFHDEDAHVRVSDPDRETIAAMQ